MVITYPYLSFSIFLLCEYCCYGAIGSFFCLLVFFRMHIVCVGVVKFSLPSFPRFFFRMHMVAVGGERLPRRMDWIVGRATEGSGGRHSSTPRGSLSPSYPNRMLRRMQGERKAPARTRRCDTLRCPYPQVWPPAPTWCENLRPQSRYQKVEEELYSSSNPALSRAPSSLSLR